ncbi:MAG TPA: hypothetical protein VN683_10380 [Acidothermaceae bacterium]|nr:hypothetical protein [Acidothermaceae bacterium]
MSIVPTSPAPVRCERANSTTTRAGAAGAAVDAALEAGTDVALEIAGDAGGVEAGGAPLDVPVVGVLVAAGETTGADVGALVCLDPELHAAANAATATSAVVRRYLLDDVSTGLLFRGRR